MTARRPVGTSLGLDAEITVWRRCLFGLALHRMSQEATMARQPHLPGPYAFAAYNPVPAPFPVITNKPSIVPSPLGLRERASVLRWSSPSSAIGTPSVASRGKCGGTIWWLSEAIPYVVAPCRSTTVLTMAHVDDGRPRNRDCRDSQAASRERAARIGSSASAARELHRNDGTWDQRPSRRRRLAVRPWRGTGSSPLYARRWT